jgi:hypothetical protein
MGDISGNIRKSGGNSWKLKRNNNSVELIDERQGLYS